MEKSIYEWMHVCMAMLKYIEYMARLSPHVGVKCNNTICYGLWFKVYLHHGFYQGSQIATTSEFYRMTGQHPVQQHSSVSLVWV